MYIIYLKFYGYKIHGWQIQAGELETFQLFLRQAFERIFKSKKIPNPCGCSRTDADVHALEYIATMRRVIDIPAHALQKGLNSLLPPNMRVVKVETADEFMDGRDLVFGKHYRYLIYQAESVSPFVNSLVWQSRYPLDLEKMQKAVPYFLGTHDFTAFSAADTDVKTKVRTIYDMKIERHGKIITIDVTGDGFLKQMIRIIGGTLVEVAKHKIAPEDIPLIIDSKTRSNAGSTLPGKGLFLYKLFRSVDDLKSYKIPGFSPAEMFWDVLSEFE